jgi:hypothetical protein
MLDPRIYRTGLIAVVLAVIVVAFSLENQPSGMRTSLVPDQFVAGNAIRTMNLLARDFPRRPPGGGGDKLIAGYVSRTLRALNYSVNTDSFTAHTSQGTRELENVTGVMAGTASSSIVIVAHRDTLRPPSAADLSGTAVLLELARVLSGESVKHSVVIASTSDAAGGSGAAALARSLPGPVDAVIVLGDAGNAHPRQPFLLPWSRGQTVAPAALTNTLAGALGGQAGLRSATLSLGGQLLHLAFPMTVSDQAPFLAHGIPAVELSLSGEQPPAAQEPVSAGSITGVGRAVLQSVVALDAGLQLPPPSSALVVDHKVIPTWSVRLLVFAFLLPVLMTTVDALARARRRRHAVLPGVVWVLSCAIAFVLAAGTVALARLAGLLSRAPRGPVAGGVAPPHGGSVAAIVVAAVVLVAALALLRPLLNRVAGARGLGRGADGEANPGAGVALSLILCVATAVLWVRNPFAALLLIPALHLWMWAGASAAPIPRPVRLLLVVLGAAVPALAVVYYGLDLNLSPLEVVWNGVLMVAGGQIGGLGIVLWSLVFACLAGAVVVALRASPRRESKEMPITVRGPVSYAGPGSLGGTGSALRR